ncbi:MAG TPA: peptidoglycan DD-metalloendopeptidase family protein, partial [Acidimicrobiales bacterium]
MPHRTLVLVLLVVAGLLSTTVAPASAADDVAVVEYRAPVPGPIVDRFDPPEKPWMRGNRGIDYATPPSTPVAAAGDGRVVFAGAIAGPLYVSVEHADGLRTTYSYLAEVRVREGQTVRAGDVVGLTRGAFHFGVRTRDGTYLDPEALLAGLLEPGVRLVPGAEEGLDRLTERRMLGAGILDMRFATIELLKTAGAQAVETLEVAVHYANEANPLTRAGRVIVATKRWHDQQQNCSSGSAPMPEPDERRIAVVVSGLGTDSNSNSAWEIDTAELGYEPSDVVRYSYTGGQASGPGAPAPPLRTAVGQGSDASSFAEADPGLADIPVREFSGTDSQQSLSVSADRLGDLLEQVAAAEPGVPIDVLAHSQGGVVARLGVVEAGRDGRLPDDVENLVTIGSPHQGAPMATAVVATGQSPGGDLILDTIRGKGPIAVLDDRLPAISQLSETSDVLADMRALPIPDGVRFTSLGGSGDMT